MEKDDIKKIVFDKFKENYDIDLNKIDKNLIFSEFESLSEKLDSLEIVTFISELEDILNIDISYDSNFPTSIDELINHLYKLKNKNE